MNKITKFFGLLLVLTTTITPITSAAYAESRVDGPSSWFLSDWFRPMHPSTWVMDSTQYRVLLGLRRELLNCVRNGDVNGVRAALSREIEAVEESVSGGSGHVEMVALKSPVKIEYFDVIVPLTILESIELGLPDVTQVLCEFGMFSRADTVRYVNAAHDREGIVKQLYAKAANGVATVMEGAEKIVDKVVAKTSEAYDSAEESAKKAANRVKEAANSVERATEDAVR